MRQQHSADAELPDTASQIPCCQANYKPPLTTWHPPASPTQHQVTEQPLEVTGTLLPWLSGQLLVNGGGDYSASKHMFDGFGLISKLRFQGGQAWGSQRYLDSNTYRAYKATGETLPLAYTFGLMRLTFVL